MADHVRVSEYNIELLSDSAESSRILMDYELYYILDGEAVITTSTSA